MSTPIARIFAKFRPGDRVAVWYRVGKYTGTV